MGKRWSVGFKCENEKKARKRIGTRRDEEERKN